MSSADPYRRVTVAGAEVAYRAAGAGPAIVVIKNNRHPLDFPLAGRYRVLQLHPVGFGASARPESYAFGSIDAQVLAVLDHEGVDRFAILGFSQPGYMAAMVARATDRAVALMVGGGSLIGRPTDATMRRLERESRLPKSSLEFWRASRRFDWHHELRELGRPVLIYLGTADPGWKRFRRLVPALHGIGCDTLEFPDLTHHSSGPGDDTDDGGRTTFAALAGWLDQRLPNAW